MSANTVKNKPVIYGLTGGIASGKSTVVKYLLNKNIKVFDSDKAVKEIWNNNTEIVSIVKDKYNIDLNIIDGKKELANLIYTNSNIKEYIESLIHPIVFDMIDDWINKNLNQSYLIIDMPLLFEVGYQNKVSKVILIYVSKEVHIHRLMNRDNISEKEATIKIKSQMDLDEKLKLSNFIIQNNDDFINLYEQINILIGRLEDESK